MSDSNTLGTRGHLPATNAANVGKKLQYKDVCGKCGAHRVDAQIGLEPTPDEYVARMVQVFRDVKRVLRDDGTLWLNLGSNYAAGQMESPLWRLRDDLSPEEIRYVLAELAFASGVTPNGDA